MTAFSEKFIAFVDVLGFKNLVADAEAGEGMSLPELLKLLEGLGTGKERAHFENSGGGWCPEAPRIAKNLDFRVTQISDCVIVSAEVSPAGLINLVSHCWVAAMHLLHSGIMCRGYIKRGRIFHTDNQVLGTGYQDAFAAEGKVTAFRREADERGTPFIEVDSEVAHYVDTQPDACVKTIFARMVKSEAGTVAVFPFQRLSHSFAIGGFGVRFDPDKERRSNQNVRTLITALKARVAGFVDPTNESAARKASHYLAALDHQLETCDRADEMIAKLASPINVAQRPK